MATRGPKAGSVNEGSANALLLSMAVGDYRYVETTPEDYAKTMRTINTPKTRRPATLAGREFECQLFTAVGSRVGDIRYLVRLSRIA